MSRMPQLDLTAACDCGAVALFAKGEAISMFQCACLNCQKVSGGGHSSVLLLPADGVRTTGATKSIARSADSGATFTRHFCPECGTTLYAQSSRVPGFRILPVGLFAGQNDWFAPNQLIFARSHPAWDLVEDHLPRHEAYRPSQKQ
ncbi:GFA family protein [Devosia faecipullorum]|uniref:GFA family protein n=1 Tax=Devosia faecipullorum TaxID=2755039 RepID=UPI00187BB575|nr:GFA family protein [Devosia faecipullorum]MBE7732078.1 GFA family protein [Devosia faecipullorum]